MAPAQVFKTSVPYHNLSECCKVRPLNPHRIYECILLKFLFIHKFNHFSINGINTSMVYINTQPTTTLFYSDKGLTLETLASFSLHGGNLTDRQLVLGLHS